MTESEERIVEDYKEEQENTMELNNGEKQIEKEEKEAEEKKASDAKYGYPPKFKDSANDDVKLYEIKNVEMFKPGVHNGEKYSKDDIEELKRNFETMKAENPDFMLPIKLGHNHKLSDGAPAAGWIDNVRVVGESLVCDFVNLPKTVYKLIKLKGLKNRSIEFIENFKTSTGKNIGKVLKAIALLGATLPAVNLRDAGLNSLGKYLYGPAFNEEQEHKSIDFDEEQSSPSEGECETCEPQENDLPAIEEKVKKEKEGENMSEDILQELKGLSRNPDKIVEQLESFKQTAKEYNDFMQKAKEKETARHKEELHAFTGELVTSGRIIPAEMGLVEAILCSLDKEQKTEFAMSEYDVKKEDTIINMFKSFLSSLPDRGLLKKFSNSSELDYESAVIFTAKKLGYEVASKDELTLKQFNRVISEMNRNDSTSKFVSSSQKEG